MKVGWEIKRLGEVCAVSKGKHDGSAKPYVGMEDIESGTGRHLGTKSPLAVKSLTFAFTPDDVLYGRLRPYLNKVLLPDFDGHCSTEVFPLRPTPALDKGFLYHWITQTVVVTAIDATCTGARMPRADVNDILKFQIPIPPLDEQRRIVAVLDKAFAGIATATANAQKNLTNARALFESYLNAIVTTQDETWAVGRLQDIGGSVSTGPFGSLLHKSDYIENGIPLVNPAHISGERIEPDYRKSISTKKLADLSAYILDENDIVIGRRGEIGRCAVVTSFEKGWLCGTGCFYIRPKRSANPYFLAHLLRSNPYRKSLEASASGATMLNLSNTTLSELQIALPQLQCQTQFLEKLDEMSVHVSKLEAKATMKLAALSELKQSLLRKAFAGELI